MLEVDFKDFIRLMLGEVMRGNETAHEVGGELFGAARNSCERWLTDNKPELCAAAPEEPLRWHVSCVPG